MNTINEIDIATYEELQEIVFMISTSELSEDEFHNAISEVLRLSSCAKMKYTRIL